MVKPGLQGQGQQVCSISLFWVGTFLSKKEKEKTQHAVTGVHNLLYVKAAAVTTL